ncbi:pre-rRNA processing [Malassezia cuniculi]|uniref:Pre-rRNA processing n=1 Tax=Malassezia cuniculi TaxID=948313 RepID=A0AAF0EX94_9BASI|nr:pre-rRNA processing [Malassezia cuniculi]
MNDVLADPGPLAKATASLIAALGAESLDDAAAAAAARVRTAYSTQEQYVLLVAFELLYQLADARPAIYGRLVDPKSSCYIPHLVHRLVHHIRAGHYASRAGVDAAPRAPALPVPGADLSVSDDSDVASLHVLSLFQCDQAVLLLQGLCCHVRLTKRDLVPLDAVFMRHLLAQVEVTRAHEAHNTAVTLLVAAINEQYMAEALINESAQNFVVDAIAHGAHKTFGENLVFVLNRTSSMTVDGMRVHLIVLKVLDQLFGAEATAHCLYTNDLRVLVDVMLRELHDMLVENEILRQVYLRVFHALVTHTQMRTIAYKTDEARRLFTAIIASGRLREVSPVTKLLAQRCLNTEWCGGDKSSPDDSANDTSYDAPHDALALGWLHSAAAAAVNGATHSASVAWPPASDEPDGYEAAENAGVDIAALDLGYLARRRAPPPPVTISTPTSANTPVISMPTTPTIVEPMQEPIFQKSSFNASMPNLVREQQLPPPVCRSTKPRASLDAQTLPTRAALSPTRGTGASADADDSSKPGAADSRKEHGKRHRFLHIFSRSRAHSATPVETQQAGRRPAPPPPPRS